jgi:transketolase
VLSDPGQGEPELILIGSGSEVSLCLAAQETLATAGRRVRVVSMPSWELFECQDEAYRQSLLPDGVTARIAVESAVVQGWERYLGAAGRFVGMSEFGASAPAKHLYEHFGISAQRIVDEAGTLLAGDSR